MTAVALRTAADWSFHVARVAPSVVVLVPLSARSQRESPVPTPPGVTADVMTLSVSSSTF